MSKLSKHIGEGEEIEINGDKFLIKPLGAKYYGEFMKIAKGFAGSDTNNTGSMFQNFTDETNKAINNIVITTLKKSFPDETDEVIDMFAGQHMQTLLPAIMKVNNLSGGDKRQQKLHDKIQKMREANQVTKDEPVKSN